ncbi:MAG: N-acetylmuramoyl-L-alanine amidase [Clostridia bacterium]|nr:N-acetylmuramoyl-L-alanine amidase [Clostridia bacterium]
MQEPQSKKHRTKRCRLSRRGILTLWGAGLFTVLLSVLLILLSPNFTVSDPSESGEEGDKPASVKKEEEEIKRVLPDWITVDLIRVDGESRRGEKLEAVRDIAVHYVGNPNTTAKANRNYFDSEDSETSSHFIVGLEGEVILCVPLDEKSSATNERNRDTISVEVCHPDATGRFSDVTRAALVRLLAYLLEEFDLEQDNLIRHYDVTGKNCPLYYVEHEDAWIALKEDAARAREEKAWQN